MSSQRRASVERNGTMKKALIVIGVVVVAALACLVACNMVNNEPVAKKPVLYLYPQEERHLTVTLDLEGSLDTVYPAPDSQQATERGTQASWMVTAAPDGTLTDRAGRTYPSLFWDAYMPLPEPDSGFVVAREDAVSFLEGKLAQLGLNDREAADFITYWAPRIRAHEYTFVSFDASAYTQAASYHFTDEAGARVEPDTFIRVFMTIREARADTVVQPQSFTAPPARTGFVAVEWGGMERNTIS